MSKKSPKSEFKPLLNKTPKEGGNASKVYDEYLSWHLGSIDFDGPWGFVKTFSNIDFHVSEQVLENLIKDGATEDVFDVVANLQGKTFSSLDELIQGVNDDMSFRYMKKVFLDIARKSFFMEIHPKIKNFENKRWKEILSDEGKRNHEVSVSQICKDAQNRLSQIDLEDVEKLVSLRLTGRQRLWGIRSESFFRVLWWDPNHSVYPSKLKHT